MLTLALEPVHKVLVSNPHTRTGVAVTLAPGQHTAQVNRIGWRKMGTVVLNSGLELLIWAFNLGSEDFGSFLVTKIKSS